MLSWIIAVTGASSAAKTTKRLLKQISKALLAELKTGTETVRETGQLKPTQGASRKSSPVTP